MLGKYKTLEPLIKSNETIPPLVPIQPGECPFGQGGSLEPGNLVKSCMNKVGNKCSIRDNDENIMNKCCDSSCAVFNKIPNCEQQCKDDCYTHVEQCCQGSGTCGGALPGPTPGPTPTPTQSEQGCWAKMVGDSTCSEICESCNKNCSQCENGELDCYPTLEKCNEGPTQAPSGPTPAPTPAPSGPTPAPTPAPSGPIIPSNNHHFWTSTWGIILIVMMSLLGLCLVLALIFEIVKNRKLR